MFLPTPHPPFTLSTSSSLCTTPLHSSHTGVPAVPSCCLRAFALAVLSTWSSFPRQPYSPSLTSFRSFFAQFHPSGVTPILKQARCCLFSSLHVPFPFSLAVPSMPNYLFTYVFYLVSVSARVSSTRVRTVSDLFLAEALVPGLCPAHRGV